MLGTIARTVFGSSNDRYVKSLRPIVSKINALEPKIQALSDEALAGQTAAFRARLTEGEKLDALLDRVHPVPRGGLHRF